MQLAYSTWGMQKVGIDEAVAHCAGLGFDGLELTVNPPWPTDAAHLDAAERRRICRLYDDHGIALCGLSGNVHLLGEEPDAIGHELDVFRSYLDLAAELQRPGQHLTVSTVSGGRKDEWDTRKDELVDYYGRLAEHAASLGVKATAEPHVGGALHLPDQVIWLVEQVNSPAFGIHFDISHFNVEGLDMEEVVAQLAPISAHTHIKDERGVEPDYQFLIPGEGDMDYVRYLRAMRRAGYDGFITIEISVMVQRRPDYDALAAATQSYRVLSRAFEEAGISREREAGAAS